MAVKTLLPGATDLAAGASWSGGVAPTADDDLIIPNGSQTIPGVDLSALVTTGVQTFHIMKGFTGTIGGGGTSLVIPMKTAYTSKPNFLNESSGFVYISSGSVTCTNAVVNGSGSTFITGGTWTNVYANAGTSVPGAAATVTNMLYGGGTVLDTFTSSIAYTTVTITGSGNVSIARAVTTMNVNGSANVTYNANGEAITTLNLNNPGATVYLVAGNITTANLNGPLDLSNLQYDATIGGTATNIYPTGSIIDDGNPRATISNISKFGGASQAGPVPN